jgi:hypothetical protein
MFFVDPDSNTIEHKKEVRAQWENPHKKKTSEHAFFITARKSSSEFEQPSSSS